MPKAKVTIKLPKVQTYLKALGLLPKGTVQTFIDSEIVRLSDPYAPSDTTALRKSVFMNTDFGSGKMNDTTSQFQDRPMRGPFWVLRMWNNGGMYKVMAAVKKFLSR